MSKAAISCLRVWRRLWRNECGVVAVVVAVLLPILIGFAGLGVEVGLWFAIQRQNQSAADAAAISAALEYAAQIQRGVATDAAAAAAAATTAANCNLFSTSSGSSNAVCPLPSSASNTITLYPCYGFTAGSSGSCNTSNSNGGPPDAVQVVLTQPLNTTFANFVTAIWGPNVNTVNVRTTAIAALPMLRHGQTCLLAVGGTNILSVPAGQTLNLPNCALASLSTAGNSIQLPSSGNPINAAAIATAGNVVITGASGATPPADTFTYFPLQDPYASVAAAFTATTPPGTCTTDPNWSSGTHTVASGAYYCGLTITGNANVTFSGGPEYFGSSGITINGSPTVNFGPGLYYIDGGNFRITGLTRATSVNLPTAIAASAGNILTFCTQGTCTGSVTVGMTVKDTARSAIQSGTTVIAVGNQTVTISNPIVNPPGVQLQDLINFSSRTASVTGSKITIVLTKINASSAGSIDIEGNDCSATISLSGTQTGQGLLQPSATASQGLLFFQDPTAVNSFTPLFNVIANNCGASNVTLNGAIYTPARSDNLQGNTAANFGGCTEFIAQSFTFGGNLGLDDTGCSAVGITPNQAQIQQVYLAM